MKPLLLALLMLFAGTAFGQGVSLPDAERIVLDNGTVLILVEKHDVPLIGFEATIRGGSVADPEGKHGLSNLLAGLLEKGAGQRTAAEFAEAVESVGGELSASADLEAFSVSGDFMAADAELLVELAADMLRRPALNNTELNKLRTRSINLIKAAKSGDPSNLLPAYANAFLFGKHPYGNPSSGSEATLANITIQDVRDHYANYFGGNRLSISVVGDFDSSTMRELLSNAFGDWSPAGHELPVVTAAEPVAGGRVLLIDKPGATQTYFRLGNVGVARSYARRAELNLANTVFGGRFTSMLVTELRTKSGLSYSARSIVNRPSQPGAVFVSSFTETSTTTEALDVAINTLSRLHDSGLDEDMLVSARNYVMGQFPPQLETASQLAAQFAMLELFGLDASYINDYGDELAAVTPEAVAEVIAEVYPSRDELVLIAIGDADRVREQLTRFGEVTEIEITDPSFHP